MANTMFRQIHQILCPECQQYPIRLDDRYCALCGGHLAILGLPEAGQIDIPASQEMAGEDVVLYTKIKNLGVAPLHVKFESQVPVWFHDRNLGQVEISAREFVLPPNPRALLVKTRERWDELWGDKDTPTQKIQIRIPRDVFDRIDKWGRIQFETNASASSAINLDQVSNPLEGRGGKNGARNWSMVLVRREVQSEPTDSSTTSESTMSASEGTCRITCWYRRSGQLLQQDGGSAANLAETERELELTVELRDKKSTFSSEFEAVVTNESCRPGCLERFVSPSPGAPLLEFEPLVPGIRLHGFQQLPISYRAIPNREGLRTLEADEKRKSKEEKKREIIGIFHEDEKITWKVRIRKLPTNDAKQCDVRVDFGSLLERQVIPKFADFSLTKSVDFDAPLEESPCIRVWHSSGSGTSNPKFGILFSTRWLREAERLPLLGEKGSLSGRIRITTRDAMCPQLTVTWTAKLHFPPLREGVLAIDFGTMNSCVAYFDAKGSESKPILVDYPTLASERANDPAREANRGIIPSLLGFVGPDAFFVGDFVGRVDLIRRENVVSSVKRCILERDRRFFGQSYAGDQLASLIMEQLLLQAAKWIDGWPEQLVMTLPANFAGPLRERMAQACRDAWPVKDCKIEIVDEPTAAAMDFVFSDLSRFPFDVNKKSFRLLVFDFGGGTLDVSIIELRELDGGRVVVQPLISRGNNLMGGLDLDIMVIKNLAEMAKQKDTDRRFLNQALTCNRISFSQMCINDGFSPEQTVHLQSQRYNWWVAARELKERLSSRASDEVNVKLFDRDDAYSDWSEQVKRDTFATMISDRIDDGVALTMSCLDALELSPEDIDFVLLAGQSCRIPLVLEKLEAVFPKKRVQRVGDLKACVAKGAAYSSAQQRRGDKFVVKKLDRTCYRFGYILNRGLSTDFVTVIDQGVPYDEARIPFTPPPNVKTLEIARCGTRGGQKKSVGKQSQNSNSGNQQLEVVGAIHLDQPNVNAVGVELVMLFDQETAGIVVMCGNRVLNMTAFCLPMEGDHTYV
ncbi:MAG: Hsp70 family protein [Candidatus Ozemobacteraceae bacterium]